MAGLEDIQPCPFCGKDFMRYEYLMEHIEKRHTDHSDFIAYDISPIDSPPPPPPRKPPSIPKLEYEELAAPLRQPPPIPTSYHSEVAPPLPSRPPPPQPTTAPTIRLVTPNASESEASSGSDGDDDDAFAVCPLEECGEEVLASEINEHIELHQAEQLTLEGSSASPTRRSQHSPHRHHRNYSSALSDSPVHPSFTSYYAPDSGPAVEPASQTMGSDTPRSPSKSSGSTSSAATQPVTTSTEPAETAQDPTKQPPTSPKRLYRKTRRRRHDKALTWSGISQKYLSFDGILGRIEGSKGKSKDPSKKSNSLRLGKKELGPYAFENAMPKWLYEQLERGPKMYKVQQPGVGGHSTTFEVADNETPGIVPMLARLSEIDPQVGMAYYCHPATMHICKTRKEGGFCGYRNIQMQVSYLQGAQAPGYQVFPRRTPGVLWLQDQIEDAWDHGISEISRSMIGKLKGTRKWIGTLEANSLYAHLAVGCEVYALSDSKDGKYAHQNLLDKVEAYFEQTTSANTAFVGRPAHKDRINRTLLPPIYLQQPGHSLTIVGLEKHIDGQRFLIVLDPMYLTSRAMNQLLDVGPRRVRKARPEVMDIYRRGDERLYKHSDFEILMLTAPPPAFPAWDVRRDKSNHT